MKRLVFFLFSAFLLLSACAAPRVSANTEIPLTLPSTPGLRSTDIARPSLVTPTPNATEIPLTGTPATMEVTLTPSPRLEAGSPIALVSIQMVDPNIGWGIEQSGHILRTRDGGGTWQDITPAQNIYSQSSFFALDANTAWAVHDTSGNGILRTTDGGQSWEQAVNPAADNAPIKLYFLDAETGWYFGEKDGHGIAHSSLANTTDGGKTWIRNDSYGAYGFYTDILIADEHTLYLSGGIWGDVRDNGRFSVLDYINGEAISSLEKTSDGGKSWSVVALPSISPFPAELKALASPDHLMACRADSLKFVHAYSRRMTASVSCQVGTENGTQWFYDVLHYFTDDGEKWHPWQPTAEDTAVNDFINPLIGWRQVSAADGKSCHFQKTINAGQSWNTLKTTTWCATQLDFVDENRGWALASAGDVTALLHTADSGKTWTDVHPLVRGNVEAPLHTAMFLGNLQRTGMYEIGSVATITGKLKWREQLGYYNFASPVVVDGSIYYATRDNGFLALDINSGQIKWSYPMTLLFSGAAPAVSNGIVYFSEQGVDGTNRDISCLYALDVMTGQETWKVCVSGWTTENSPAISDDVVYWGAPSELLALDARTGQEKWRVGPGILGSVALADDIIYFNGTDSYLYAMDINTGKGIWKFGLGNNYNYATAIPVISSGMVYLGGPDYLYAIDAKTGQEQWRFEAGRGVKSVVVDGRTVYFVSKSTDQIVYALDAFSGKLKWKFSLGRSEQVYSFSALSNGVLYVGSDNKLCALDATTGQEQWRYSDFEMATEYGSFSAPIIADGVLYFAFGKYLYAVK